MTPRNFNGLPFNRIKGNVSISVDGKYISLSDCEISCSKSGKSEKVRINGSKIKNRAGEYGKYLYTVRCDDAEYYLSHDFYKKEDKNGTPFVKSFADVDSPGDNFVIYAHNMKNGTMFGNLDDYENENFAKEHSIIEFDSLYEKRHYKVISVFRSEVFSEKENNDDKFKYYEYYNAESPEDFAYFYGNIMHLSSYKSDVKASYGDRFITLSTCAYHTDNGRFVVVAKEIR